MHISYIMPEQVILIIQCCFNEIHKLNLNPGSLVIVNGTKRLNDYKKNDMRVNNLIIFDEICLLCSWAVQFVIKHDRQKKFHFASMDSSTAHTLFKEFKFNSEMPDTIVLVQNRQIYIKSDAVLKIARDLSGAWKYLGFFGFVPRKIRDKIYTVISSNRYNWFGKRTSCFIPSDSIKNRFLT